MNGLPFSRFWQLRGLLVKARQERIREEFILAAFVSWQLGAGSDKKFGRYLEELGLEEHTAEVDLEDKKLTVEDAISKAESILAMAREKK